MKPTNTIWFFLVVILIHGPFFKLNAQVKTPDKIAERFFLPAIQMGYINHNSENITSGLVIQTSVEYRAKRGLLLRINYDDFNGRLNLNYSSNQSYSAKIPISEFIGGFGYRIKVNRSNYFFIAQTGLRFYENPVIENSNGNLSIEQKDASLGTIRYTLGYEYELFDNIYFNTEIFSGHFYRSQDFWNNSRPHFGITAGISARLF